MPLAGVSESRLKSKLFALRFPPNLTHSGSSRPSWLFERRFSRNCRGMSPGSASAFRCSCLPQAPVRAFRGPLGGSESRHLTIIRFGPSLTLGVDFRGSESVLGNVLWLAPPFITCLPRASKAPSTSSAFRATSSLFIARTMIRLVPRGVPSPRYSACVLHSEK